MESRCCPQRMPKGGGSSPGDNPMGSHMDKVTQGSGRPEDREAGLPRRDATDEEVGFVWVGSKSGFSCRGELTTKLNLSGPMAHSLSTDRAPTLHLGAYVCASTYLGPRVPRHLAKHYSGCFM